MNDFLVLNQARKALPDLLRTGEWKSLHIDDELPHVNRVWTMWGKFRICLHEIMPCAFEEEPLMHRHAWPAWMRVESGLYEMKVGYGRGEQPEGNSVILNLAAGSEYAMLNLNGFHSVKPIGEPSLSLMVNGMPWGVLPERKVKKELTPLWEEKMNEILGFFRSIYK